MYILFICHHLHERKKKGKRREKRRKEGKRKREKRVSLEEQKEFFLLRKEF